MTLTDDRSPDRSRSAPSPLSPLFALDHVAGSKGPRVVLSRFSRKPVPIVAEMLCLYGTPDFHARSHRDISCGRCSFPVLYLVRNEWMVMEQRQYNLLFRWFVGLGMNDADAREGEVIVAVRDTGPGIPRDELHAIFDAYTSIERRGQPGTGLGLYISKAIVERHGGRIWVESQLGEGTTFFFHAPAGLSACAAFTGTTEYERCSSSSGEQRLSRRSDFSSSVTFHQM